MKMRKATKAERARLLKAVESGNVAIGNKAVVEKKTPHVRVFKNPAWKHGADSYPASSGFVLSWAEPGTGFGEITFIEKDGHFEIQTECMGIQFVIRQVVKMLANAKVVE